MKIKDLKEIIPINISQVEVDATSAIEHFFFEKPGHSDYRTDSINFMTKQKINFHSTCNSAFNVMKQLVKIACPTCHKNMQSSSGSGSGDHSTMGYTCLCGTKVSLTIPSEGLHVSFKEND